MVCANGALIPMQVLAPFQANLKNCHKLPVNNMAPGLRGGELLVEEFQGVTPATGLQPTPSQMHHIASETAC